MLTQTFLKKWTEDRESTEYIVLHARLTPDNPRDTDIWFRKRGYLQCGFHFCVSRSGITETRDHHTVGAHVGALDTVSVAVGILGWDGQHPDTLDPLSRANLKTLLGILSKEYPHAQVTAAPNWFSTKGEYTPLIELAEEANHEFYPASIGGQSLPLP